MSLESVDLTQYSRDLKCFEQINNTAFPESEWMSFDAIFSFASKTDTDVLGIYDAEIPVGFVVLLKNTECAYVYFIAIDEKFRSNGYGSTAISEIIGKHPEPQIIVDFEVIDETAENNTQRIRRRNFYLKNGFHETGNYTFLNKDRFEVVCSGRDLRKEAFKDFCRMSRDFAAFCGKTPRGTVPSE